MEQETATPESEAVKMFAQCKERPAISLINPPVTRAQRAGPLGPVIKNLYFNSPPLGIAYIAAILEREGAHVQLIDAAVEDFSMEETVEKIKSFGPIIVGITSTTNFFCNSHVLMTQRQ